jgi:hypothetical protein
MTKKPEITLPALVAIANDGTPTDPAVAFDAIARGALAGAITQFIDENRPALDRLAAKAAQFIDENRSFIEHAAKTIRRAKILESAFKEADMPGNKIKLAICKMLLEIAAGPVDAKSSRGGKRSAEKRRETAANGWQAVAGPRADEIKRKNPSFKPNRIKTTMMREDPTGLPGERTLADFIKHRFLTK